MWWKAYQLIIFVTVTTWAMGNTDNGLAAGVFGVGAAWVMTCAMIVLGAPLRWFLRIADHGKAIREAEAAARFRGSDPKVQWQ